MTAYCTDNYLSDWSFDSSLFDFTLDESSPGVDFYPPYLHDSAAGTYTYYTGKDFGSPAHSDYVEVD